MQIEIVGPRGSGKTTFANALLAAPVLPYFVGSPRAPPTVSIARCSVNNTGAKNFMHAAKVLLDGRVHQVSGSGGSLSLQLEALAGHDQVDRIHVELASDLSPSETVTVTENHVPLPLAPPEPSTLRVLVARWEYLEADADKYLRANGLRDGLLIVNMNQTESSSSLSLDEVRALASTRLGVEARSVFAVNARLALANALLQEAAPATTIPHQGALQSIKHKVASWMAAKSTSSNVTAAGPRYRVESATSSSAATTQVAAPDRYVPSVFQPFHMESPPPQRPPRSSRNDGSDDVSNADRYELVARRDARMVVEGLNFQYTPKVTAP